MDLFNRDSINDSLKKDLLTNSLDLSYDYGEIAIDSIYGSGLLEEIPIVKSLASLAKMGHTIREMHLTKKMLCFLREFHSHSLSDKSLKFKIKLHEDIQFKNKVTERILVTIDRFDSEVKAVHLAQLFTKHIEEELSWDMFVYFSACVEAMHKIDLQVLKYLKDKQAPTVITEIRVDYTDKYFVMASVERLVSFGFIGHKRSSPLTWNGTEDYFLREISISSLGDNFLSSLS